MIEKRQSWADKTFHAEQVRRNREFLQGVTGDVFGVSLRIRCEMDQDEDGGAAQEDDGAASDERVQMAIDIFDGEVAGR
jgi:hypothetical protein